MLLYDIPTAVLIIALLLVMTATVEISIRIGQRFGQPTQPKAHDVHTALAAAAPALMGLMLAFTFNMSVTRFDVRKTLLVTEANAIQSVHSDLEFLASHPQSQALRLLHNYTNERIAFLTVGNNPDRERRIAVRARALHGALWQVAISPANYTQADPAIRAAQYVQFTRDLLNLNSIAREREAERTRHVPEAALFMLFVLAIGSAAVLSYTSGVSGHPNRLPTYIVVFLMCLVIYLIIDFDRPRRGLMHLDAAPLRQLFSSPQAT